MDVLSYCLLAARTALGSTWSSRWAVSLGIGLVVAVTLAPAAARPVHPAMRERPAATLNWPQFRFNDDHTGLNPFEQTLTRQTVPRLRLAWQAQLGELIDYSSPVVVNGTVYIGSTDGRLWAYGADGCGQDLCTTPQWRSSNLTQIMDSPTVWQGKVFIGSQTSFRSNDGKLNAFSAAGCGRPVCHPLWRGLAGADSILQSSPMVANGVVFVGTYGGSMYAFNANGCGAPKCQPLWRGVTNGPIESTPTISNGVVYIGSDDGNLYAFDARGCGSATCSPLWTGLIGGSAFSSTPAIADGVVYIAAPHALSAFAAAGCHASTCAPLWQAVDTLNFFNGSPAVGYHRVYIPLENGLAIYAAGGCGQTTCQPLWTDFAGGAQAAIVSSPTLAHGVVYAGRNTGEVLAWSAAGCGSTFCPNTIWEAQTGDEIVSSSPTVVNGKLYIGSADDHFSENISGRIYTYTL